MGKLLIYSNLKRGECFLPLGLWWNVISLILKGDECNYPFFNFFFSFENHVKKYYKTGTKLALAKSLMSKLYLDQK